MVILEPVIAVAADVGAAEAGGIRKNKENLRQNTSAKRGAI